MTSSPNRRPGSATATRGQRPAPASGWARRRRRGPRRGPRSAARRGDARARRRRWAARRPARRRWPQDRGEHRRRSSTGPARRRPRRPPSAGEQLGQPLARRRPRPPRAAAGFGRRRAAGAQRGDRDPVRPPRLDAGLDRGADVVDVHVHVPLPAARACPRRPRPGSPRARPAASCSRRDRRLVGVGEQVLHLVAGPVAGRAGASPARCTPGRGGGRRASGGADRRHAGHRARPARRAPGTSPRPPASTTPARPAPAAARGCASSAARRAVGGGADDVGELGAAVRRPRGRGRGARAGDGEEGALHRVGHRRVRRRRPPCAAPRPAPRRRRGRSPASCVGQAAQQLGEDHAGVAAGAEHRAAGEHAPTATRPSAVVRAGAAASRAARAGLRRSAAGWCRCHRRAPGRR